MCILHLQNMKEKETFKGPHNFQGIFLLKCVKCFCEIALSMHQCKPTHSLLLLDRGKMRRKMIRFSDGSFHEIIKSFLINICNTNKSCRKKRRKIHNFLNFFELFDIATDCFNIGKKVLQRSHHF